MHLQKKFPTSITPCTQNIINSPSSSPRMHQYHHQHLWCELSSTCTESQHELAILYITFQTPRLHFEYACTVHEVVQKHMELLCTWKHISTSSCCYLYFMVTSDWESQIYYIDIQITYPPKWSFFIVTECYHAIQPFQNQAKVNFCEYNLFVCSVSFILSA